jgi:hypothetical protein
MSIRPAMARPLGVRGHQKNTHLISSMKGEKYKPVESLNEGTTLLALDIDPRTCSITPQPFTVRLDLEKVFKTKAEALKAKKNNRLKAIDEDHLEKVYTPDFLVELTSPVPLVVESKSATSIEKIRAQLERRKRVLNDLGYRFLVVSDEDLGHEGLHTNLANLRDATKYRKEEDTRELMTRLTRLVELHREPFPLSAIRRQVSDVGIYLGLINGVIACDLKAGEFNVNTVLWPAHGELTHLQLLNLEF